MEFIGNHSGSRNISCSFYLARQEEEEEDLQHDVTYKRPPFPAPSSSSSSSSCALRWREAVAASSEINRGGDKVPEKEHMFDKVVTPSDVGKLNRLVIPKQQAEKHFPLDTASAAEKKGLLLCFEDRATGKPWRFRYSYWHSSQSYVMTKGWSRFVKEKGLRAGDTVSFARGVGDGARHRFFIDCKRQPEKRFPSAAPAARIPLPGFSSFAPPWVGGRAFFPSAVGHRLLYFKMPATRPPPPPPQMEVQQVGGGHRCFANEKAATGVKRVRLFGVNLDCPGSGGGPSYSQLLQPPISSPPQLPPPLPPPLRIKEQRSAMDLYL